MESLPPTVYVAIGAIVAAMISGFWSLVSLIVSKDQKVSEFRQAWIDRLREESADYIAQIIAFSTSWDTFARQKKGSGSDFIEANIERISKLEAQRVRIRLRLNPSEHVDMLTILDDLDRMVGSPKDVVQSHFTDTCTKFEKESQVVLKKEWERVKSGERSFRYLRNAAIAVLLLSTVAILFNLYA